VSRSGIDAAALAYIDKNKWQLLQDNNGVIRVYDSNYARVPEHSYIQDNFGAPDAGFSFFINPDGQYYSINDIRPDENGQKFNPNDPAFGKQIAKYISALSSSYAQSPIEWAYNPYVEYTQ
jgi:hypothetical protein